MLRLPHTLSAFIIALATLTFSSSFSRAENWKGKTETSPIEVGALGGIALFGSSVNWSVVGTGAYLILPEGFIDDIDDRVWVEGQMGPAFFSSNGETHTGLQFAGQLRWDFTLNQDWTFYSIGGLGGFYLPTSAVQKGYVTVHPRFGVGAEFQTKLPMMFRMELASDFIGAGVVFNF